MSQLLSRAGHSESVELNDPQFVQWIVSHRALRTVGAADKTLSRREETGFRLALLCADMYASYEQAGALPRKRRIIFIVQEAHILETGQERFC